MRVKVETRLTSGEIADLWLMYMTDSMTVCSLKHFEKTVEDPDIRPLVKYALGISQKHVQKVKEIFNRENLPVPHGFTDDDLDLNTPRLFSDLYYPFFLEYWAKFGMVNYGTSLPLVARADVRELNTGAISSSVEISNRVVEVLIQKGLYVRPPYITVPKHVEFVQRKSFLGGWFGKQRPLLATEVLNLYSNIRSNTIGHILMLGYGQVARSDKVRRHFFRGKDIATKHIEVFSEILRNEDIPASTTWETGVTASKVSPFSDKMMMFQTSQLATAEAINYSTSMSVSMRRDLIAAYTRLAAEAMSFAEDTYDLMIENGWLEQPPQHVDHVGMAAK
ncbi:MAG: DUF3231 family protein [Firmicutes bacterium]|nr:DUF3231 family protein [Bacillota bacterium]